MEGILIGTGILWLLNLLLVLPLTNLSLRRRMAAEGVAAESMDGLPDEEQQRWKGVATGYYILWDVIVLGTAGLVGGLLGFWFIGISTEARGWPGMIAFIGASFAGLALGTNGHGLPR